MHQGETSGASRQLEALWTTGTMIGLSDAQLLLRFAQSRDSISELAFGELLNRHAPMVWGVCRRILAHPDDADDAFQATFLILVRKARSIQTEESIAPWLYSVAYRTAQRARAVAARYRPRKEDQIQDVAVAPDDAYQLDVRPILYEELGRLPSKYRSPIVLCHLEGKTHEEAARLLKWPLGTVSGRLSRGRQLLRSRLERRGVTVPSALLGASWLTSPQVHAMTPLVGSTLRASICFAAAQTVPTSALSLAHGVLRTMLFRKLATVAAAVLLAGAITGGTAAWVHGTPAPAGQSSQGVKPASASRQDAEAKPTPGRDSAPKSDPEQSGDSQDIVAQDCTGDCPLTQGDEAKTYCPISMAANAIGRMFGHSADRTVASK